METHFQIEVNILIKLRCKISPFFSSRKMRWNLGCLRHIPLRSSSFEDSSFFEKPGVARIFLGAGANVMRRRHFLYIQQNISLGLKTSAPCCY